MKNVKLSAREEQILNDIYRLIVEEQGRAESTY